MDGLSRQHGVSNSEVVCTESVAFSGKKATSGQGEGCSQLARRIWFGRQSRTKDAAPEWTERRDEARQGEAAPESES